jgi:diamine N-acetyltransferase
MTTVELVPVDKDNWRVVTKLKVADGQQDWVAPNWYSIIEALFEGYESKAIVVNGEIVGYAMYAIGTDKRTVYVDRLMLAEGQQGKGYGRAALTQILDEFRQREDIDRSMISVVPGNDAAEHLYKSLGYVDTGRIEHGEKAFEMDLRTDAAKSED